MMQEMSLAAALKTYFGFKPGQKLIDFMAELKELTPEDKEYFKREFLKVGIKVTG